ncbi:MAG: HmuY family protein [Bacteroidales bacterium]
MKSINILRYFIRTKFLYFVWALAMLFSSCFKEESPIYIVESKADQDVNTLAVESPFTIYNYYTYIDLDSVKTIKSVAIASWDLGFEASPSGYRVIVNSAIGNEIYPTGQTDFLKNYSNTNVPKWLFDSSNGHPDSTAVGNWVSGTSPGYTYTGQVYLLGKNNGDGTYVIIKKLVFTMLSDTSIVFIAANPESTVADTITIKKNPNFQFVYYLFDSPNQTLYIEPPKDQWDIVAGSYRTIIYTDDGVPTPYTVRGVLSNYPYVKAVKVNKPDFYISEPSDTTGLVFSNYKDAIGYDWKEYNSAESTPYRVVPDVYYYIITKKGNLVKMEFTNYVNANAEFGYPVMATVNFE